MANEIAFAPKAVDPKLELQRRLNAAPVEHAEALLVAYDLLEAAHRQGVLDALLGAVGARDTLLGLMADYSVDPIAINALRNLMTLGKLAGALNPEPISNLSKEFAEQMGQRRKTEPLSLWSLLRRLRGSQARRGLQFLISILAALGSAAE